MRVSAYSAQLLFAISLSLTASPYSFGEQVTLQELDAILSSAGSVRVFVSNGRKAQVIRERLYEKLSEYYGIENFPRESYDAVLEQLALAIEKEPALGKRLWETTGLGEAFEIETHTKTSGLVLKRDAWERHVKAQMAAIEKDAAAYEAMGTSLRDDALKEDLAQVAGAIARFEKSLDGLDRRARAERARVFYRVELPSNPKFKAAGAYLAQRLLSQRQIADLFMSGDADVVIDTIRRLRDPNAFDWFKGIEGIPENVKLLLRGRLLESYVPAPQLPSLTIARGRPASTEFFKVDVRRTNRNRLVPVGRGDSTTYHFVPLPRRIFGIFKGIALKECIGGDPGKLESLIPARWGTVAVAGTQLHHVEKNGRYVGFVQATPISNGDETYASVDFGSTALGRKTLVPDGRGGFQATSLYRQWLDKARAQLPKNWKGYVVTGDKSVNNAGVKETVFASPSYYSGKLIGLAGEFEASEPSLENVNKLVHRKGDARSFPGPIIVDATGDYPTSQLVLLESHAESSWKPENPKWKEPKAFLAVFRDATNEQKRQLLSMLRDEKADSLALWWLALDPDTDVARRARLVLEWALDEMSLLDQLEWYQPELPEKAALEVSLALKLLNVSTRTVGKNQTLLYSLLSQLFTKFSSVRSSAVVEEALRRAVERQPHPEDSRKMMELAFDCEHRFGKSLVSLETLLDSPGATVRLLALHEVANRKAEALYREKIVKLAIDRRERPDVRSTALALVARSGGIGIEHVEQFLEFYEESFTGSDLSSLTTALESIGNWRVSAQAHLLRLARNPRETVRAELVRLLASVGNVEPSLRAAFQEVAARLRQSPGATTQPEVEAWLRRIEANASAACPLETIARPAS